MKHLRSLLLFLFGLSTLVPFSPLEAACTNPTAEAGARDYFTATKNYRLCDGASWIDFNTNGTAGSCSSAAEAEFEYDSTSKYFKWCNGTSWIRAERASCTFNSSSLSIASSVSNSTYLADIRGLEVSADRTKVYTAAWNRITIWDVTAKPAAPVYSNASASNTSFQGLAGMVRVGSWLLVANQNLNGVMAVNISAATPTYNTAHRFVATSTQMDNINGLIASADGNYLYTSSYNSGGSKCWFHVLNISNPAAITLAGTLDLTPSTGPWCNNLGLGKNNHVYLSSASGLTTINVSNPGTPVLADTIGNANTSQANALAVSKDGNTAYTISQSGNTRLCTYNTSNPANISVTACVSNAAFNNSYTARHAGRYVMSTNVTGDSFSVADVMNPASPALVATVTHGTTLNTANYLVVDGRYAYVGTETGTILSMIDMGCDPEIQPVNLGTCTETGAIEYFPTEKALAACNGSTWFAIAQ